ncbi:glycoside hydrolase [Setomelanomma holmii]|uniref:chitinase n=1 Tax=Setomelanomma holmii TaxID=210430 RepID=A0A9P4GXP1_9PLEO|nr:glycoside hydrolase [Setomelanomma holmii]
MRLLLLLINILTTFATVTTKQHARAARQVTEGFRNVAYFVNWVGYWCVLTHVIYAFANVHPETGEVYLSDTWSDTDKRYPSDSWNESGANVYGCAKQLYLQKKRNRKLKTLLSIGGWTYSSSFAQPASTSSGRVQFASTAVQLVTNLGFDGLDIDWEYPQNEAQASDFVALLAETRNHLDAYEKRHQLNQSLLLTVAAPAGPTNYNILKLASMDSYLDFWNLMTYDYSVSGEGVAAHNANWNRSTLNPKSTPFNSDETIMAYIKAGIPAKKIVVGMPLYGRSFANTDGPGKAFSGTGIGTWEPGIYDYKTLSESYGKITVDPSIAASWSYDSTKRLMISFDTPNVTLKKTEYIKTAALGGAMWWESSSDKLGSESLISTFVQGIGGASALEDSRNLLQYPDSVYENIRDGMSN